MTTLSQEQFKELQSKVGGLPLTEAERASLIQTLDKEIEELQNTIQSKIPKDMADEITNLATIQAEQIAESAAKILTTKMQARIPASILGTVDVQPDFGALSQTIDLKANEIFKDVGKFHDQFSKKNIPGAKEYLTDILEPGESAEIKLAFSEIKNLFGSDKKYMKEIKGQIDAFVAVNKLFSKQYKRLDGKTTLDSYYVARELAQDFVAQKKKVVSLEASLSLIFAIQYKIGFSYVVDEDMLTRYDGIIGELENAAGVEDDIIRDYYLVEETGLTTTSIENYDFSERASAVARDFFKTVTQADFDAMSADEIREAIKGIAIRHARSTFQSYKSRGLTAAGKVSDILIENTKAAAKEAMLAGSALVAAGQVAGEMGLDAITAYRERPRAPRNIEDLEISEDAMRYLESPESYGIPAAEMRMGLAERQALGIIPKARMTSEVTPGQRNLASLLGSQEISQKLQEDLDANETLINEFISRPEIDEEVAKRLKAAGSRPTAPAKFSSSYPVWVAKEKQIRSDVEKEIGVTGEDRAKYEALLGERQAILDEAAEFGIVLDNPRKKRKKKASCPPATQDLELNTKNRDAAVKAEHIQYGPLNLSDEDYWVQYAERWNTTPAVAKKSNCSNCIAFDISPRMKDCMPGKTSDKDGELGYCWMHHFKCHSARSCYTWAKGGPISKDKVSHEWQERAFPSDNPPVRKNSSHDYFHARRLVKVLKERGNEMQDFDRASAQQWADMYLAIPQQIDDKKAHEMLYFFLEPYGLHTAAPSGYDDQQSAYLANPGVSWYD